MISRRRIAAAVLAILCSIACLGQSAHAQHSKKRLKKQPTAEAKDSSRAAITSLMTKDSLVVTEVKLPLADSADDRPMFSLDGSIMVFGSRRPPMPGETWRQRQQAPYFWDGDIYYRVYTDTGWSIPINAGPQINNSGDQNNPTISPGGDEIVYVNNGTIMRSKFIGGSLQKPEVIPGDIQNIYGQLQIAHFNYANSLRAKVLAELNADSEHADLFRRAPDTKEVYFKEKLINALKDDGGVKFFQGTTRFESAFSPDGHYVIFSENFGKKGEYGFDGEGDDDLWALTISSNGRWDTVRSINGKINSRLSESYPFMAADGLTLYFTSNRPCATCPQNTQGYDDIYMSKLTDTGFTKPVALPYPINDPSAGDYGLTITADGSTAYFVSNRSGKSKFYQVRLRSQDSTFMPTPVVLVSGTLRDQQTHAPLKGQVFVDELTEGKASFSVYTNDSGVYILAVRRGHRFGLQAVADKHLPKSERFTYPKSGAFNRSKLDFDLAPIEVGASTEFKNVYFETAKSDLLPESKPELDRVAEFLHRSRTASIEIDGHTDDVGNEAYNEKLSLDRATSVMNYLISKGIAKERLEAKGFGKRKPLKHGTDEASRAMNRRVEMVVTSYSK